MTESTSPPSDLPPEWNPVGAAETRRECGPHEKTRQFGSGSRPKV